MGLDPQKLIDAFGLLGIWAIVFAESGLLVGFFLPGDALLFTAGFLASGPESLASSGLPRLNLVVLIIGIVVSAVAGDQVGYLFGKRVGPALFKRPDSRFFKQQNVEKASGYFDRYGPRTIVLARFVPIVRTFAPIVAGVSDMDYKTFVRWNVIGGVVWGTGVTLLGYFLGQVDVIAEHIELTIVAVVGISCLPIAIELIRARRHGADDPVSDAITATIDEE
jgi:membrane-associated protein